MNNQIFRIAQKIYADIVQIDPKQYEKAMYDFYTDNKRFVDFTLQSDRQAQNMFKRMYPDAQVHTLSNGNTYLKYMQLQDKIILLALLSKNGKLTRQDAVDAISQLNFLLDKLYQGKSIQTSCNNKSLPLLNRLKKMDQRVKIEKVTPDFDVMGQGTWANYIAYI